jgi:hypothetical protein
LIAVGELGRVCALELALEEPIQLRITRRLLTVLDAEGIWLRRGLRVKDKILSAERNIRTYGVARLLAKDLSKLDHILRIQLFGEVHHYVGIVLLITRTRASEKSVKGGDSDRIALRAAPSSILMILTSW